MTGFDRAAIQDLSNYMGYAWNELTQIVASAGDETFLRPAPGSGWPSLRDCFGHIVFAYDRWLSVAKGASMQGFDIKSVNTLQRMNEAHRQFRTEFQRVLDSTSDDDLHRVREMQVYGEPLQYSTGELLVHQLLHERGHHGDVTTLFYQLGIEPDVLLEYRFMLGRHTAD